DGLTLSAIVINRFLDERSLREVARETSGPALEYLEEIRLLEAELADDIGKKNGTGAVIAHLVRHRHQTLDAIARVGEFAGQLPAEIKVAVAPELGLEGMHDLGGLRRIAEVIMSGPAMVEVLERTSWASAVRRSRRAALR